jgi:Flp pilus assembly protein TadG
MRRRLLGSLKDDIGATMVEAALITPFLLLLTFSIVDFASMFYCYLSLENGVSQATRFAVTGATLGGASREESIKAAMRQATPTLTIPDSAFSFSNMPAGGGSFVAGIGGPGAVGRVTVDYEWELMTPLIRPFFTGGKLHIRVRSTMKNEKAFPS